MENRRIQRLRRQLARHGYILRKSRVTNVHADNLGGDMILLANCNGIVAGCSYCMSLDDAEHWANDYS